ncbi:MAG: ATP-grasp domain-containing protein [Burkholderiales bacterium]|jgi:predicted ATP-grasp superfamily ATP-dependent carboligase
MRILVYEHITGGGMLNDSRMAALAPEGEAMLRALVDDLTDIPGTEATVLRDFRLTADLPAAMRIVRPGQFAAVFRKALSECDAVWPIAPETDGILFGITSEILLSGRALLASRPDAIAVAASKLATVRALASAGIAVAEMFPDESRLPALLPEIVAKPDDGAGCQDTLLFRDREHLRAWCGQHAQAKTVFQVYVSGEARSLSLLCCDGRVRILACNRQHVEIHKGIFHFSGVSVNAVAADPYARLASAVACAMPGLWGLCGVDFVETESGPVVIEVNPRLTTSYAGLRSAIGINPAQLVLELPESLATALQAERKTRIVEVAAHAG